jgi:peptide/nickel transport system ATP-binding protein
MMSAVERVTTASSAGGPRSVALEVTELRVVLAGTEIDIAAHVSFSLAPGEVLGLVGESGSGKTTVALALLAYARSGTAIQGGSVAVGGVDVLSLSSGRLRQLRGKTISYVPQDPSSWLNPSLRIGSQIVEKLEQHGFGAGRAARQDRVVEALEEVDLPSDPEYLRRYPHQLSGGQQQRVALALAFACRPAVVVLDEPTTGLDVTTQAHVLRTVRELARTHRAAAVYVSHDLAVVAGLADRTAVMYAGRIVEIGPTREIVERATHPYTRRLLAAAPDPKSRRPLVGIPGRVAPLGPAPPGCSFADRCDFAEAACRAAAISEELVSPPSRHYVRCRRWEFVVARAEPVAAGVAVARTRRGGEAQLTVDNLTARYGRNEVLHGVSLSIPRGECLALVGESGSGKTTLARCISGMHKEGAGDIRFGGERLAWGAGHRAAESRRAVQYIFQSPYSSLNPRKTVRQVLEQPIRQFDCAPAQDAVGDLLEQVSLPASYARRYPAQLSGGERQRVAIARALSVAPSLLICDEITSALDVSVQASILALLARLHAETMLTVLFVTHNLSIVRAIADSVIVLDQGLVVEEGSVEDVLDSPQHPYTQSLLRDTPGFA